MKTSIQVLLLALALTACQNSKEVKEDARINGWNGEAAPQVENAQGEKVVPQTFMNCRAITMARNVHVYYQVYGDIQNLRSVERDGITTYTVPSATVRITKVVINAYDGQSSATAQKILFNGTADLTMTKGEKVKFESGAYSASETFSLVATSATESYAQESLRHTPFFNRVRAGETFFKGLKIAHVMGEKTLASQSEQDMPGLHKGDKMDCQTLGLTSVLTHG